MEKKKYAKSLTPDEIARRERTDQMLQERIAYHEARVREQEAAGERKQPK